jgi:2-polyprenyl-3-methyl-5-hydroxy-6-metoxy-1,4-benzoquinol methylase
MNLKCDKFLSVTACPGCGSAAYRETGAIAPEFACLTGGREFKQPPYAIHECSACGLLYKNNTASPPELNAYYARVDFRKWEIPGFFPNERAVHAVLRQLPPGARILDFGCSSGRLLAQLTTAYDCYGHEINLDAARIAADKGIQMLSTEALHPRSCGLFDAVVMVDVFEHLPAPTELLENLFQLVKPGGMFLIATGNGDTPICRRDPSQFWYFRNVEHLCMLTRRYTEWTAQMLNAAIIHWQEMSHYDCGWRQQFWQRSRNFAYWNTRPGAVFRSWLRFVPMFSRAIYWKCQPEITCTKDHVLVVLRKIKE